MMQRSRRAFTLIELLVVIAIIAILAAILFPVFAKAREKARQSSCSSNLKQMSLAVLQYAQDYDETYPMALLRRAPGVWNYWYTRSSSEPGLIGPYVKSQQIFVCPSKGVTGYGFNRRMMGLHTENSNDNTPTRMAQVEYVAEKIMLGDNYSTRYYIYNDSADDVGGTVATYGLYPIHNSGANVAFMDGHIKWRGDYRSMNRRSGLWYAHTNP